MSRSDFLSEKEFLDAAAAVYAWVSAADGDCSPSEVKSFVDYLAKTDFVQDITEADFLQMYVSLLESFSLDFEDGKARAQSRIEPFKDDDKRATSLVTLARKALVADGRLQETEEVVLAEIADLLEVDEEHLKS